MILNKKKVKKTKRMRRGPKRRWEDLVEEVRIRTESSISCSQKYIFRGSTVSISRRKIAKHLKRWVQFYRKQEDTFKTWTPTWRCADITVLLYVTKTRYLIIGSIGDDMMNELSLLGCILFLFQNLLLLPFAILHQIEGGLTVYLTSNILKDWIMMIYFCLVVLILIFSTMFCMKNGVRRSFWDLIGWLSWWLTSNPWEERKDGVLALQ